MARLNPDDDLAGQRDPWGRLPGDPGYGVDPNEPINGGGGDPTQQQHPPDQWGRPWGDPEYGVPPQTREDPTTPTGTPPTFTAPTMRTIPGLPTVPNAPVPDLPAFTKPPAFSYADYEPGVFKAPSVEEALQDPGYQFRTQQGEGSLQRWAARNGTLNDSGTAKALIDYGQNAASQEYRNVWDRGFNAFGLNEGNRFKAYTTNRENAADAYRTNYQTQFVDPFKFQYQAALDRFNPQLETWREQNAVNRLGYTTTADATQRANEFDYNAAWQKYLADMDLYLA